MANSAKFIYELAQLASPELSGLGAASSGTGIEDLRNPHQVPSNEGLLESIYRGGILREYRKYIQNKDKWSEDAKQAREEQNRQRANQDQIGRSGGGGGGRQPRRYEENKEGGAYERVPDEDLEEREPLIPPEEQRFPYVSEIELDDPHIEQELQGLDEVSLTILYAGLNALYTYTGKKIKEFIKGEIQIEPLTEKDIKDIEEHHEKLEKPRERCRRIVRIGQDGKLESVVVCEDGYFKFD